MALFPGLPGWAGTRMVKPIWILLKQEIVSGSGISWAIRKSAPRSRQPVPHHSSFHSQVGCPSCRPTNSVKALKVILKSKINKKSCTTRQAIVTQTHGRRRCCSCRRGAVVRSTSGRRPGSRSASCSRRSRRLRRTPPRPRTTRPRTTPLLSRCASTSDEQESTKKLQSCCCCCCSHGYCCC